MHRKEYQLLGCGFNKDWQIGDHLNEKNKPLDILIQPTKIQLPDDTRIFKGSCGRTHSLILSKDGRVFTLGNNAYGQCSQHIIEDEDYYNNQGSVSLVKGDIKNERIVKLAYAADCCLALNDKAEVFGWGNCRVQTV
ncbi:RCC1-like G exchanging factor-like protein [Lepeophtheirus salmonis]|uniref:RCC1-like G exchanging factor-like protein n=1 Tax=Lepeophtheirus salmonis TaxID=72036 RepID=UPI003AF341AC